MTLTAPTSGPLSTGSLPLTVPSSPGPPSRPYPLGASVSDAGPDAANVAVYAPGQKRLDVVYTAARFPTGQAPRPRDLRRTALLEVTDGVHHGTVPGLGYGSLYGFVTRGVPVGTPAENESPVPGSSERPGRAGHPGRAGQAPVLTDPWGDAVVEHEGRYWSVRVPAGFNWNGVERPRTPWRDSVIYEAHVVGQTKLHPGIPEQLRGTYAGMAHPVMVQYLQRLGVTAVELLPVHHHADETHLQALGLSNYWGYNTVSYFAPDPSYATVAAQAAGPAAVQDEFKGMVKLLHEAGIEVILDVVYNHTAEEGPDGPTFCWRGLGESSYYRTTAAGHYVDTTGCGNALDFSHPQVVRMTLDSLRRWVEDFGVDGFRFDLAVTLCRDGANRFTGQHPLLVAIAADPVLAGTKLISEPWDVGEDGWQTGRFPPGWADWNDQFRDTVREFWVADRGALDHGGTGASPARLADVLCGSTGLFAGSGRSTLGSVNHVTAHDGFTMADLVSYNHKHNEANGEDNRDGSGHNRSYHHGAEGPTSDRTVQADRQQTARNLMATLLLSLGVPMITAGDEIGRTQRGNNNAYCQDNELSWTDWNLDPGQERMLEVTRRLVAVRREFLANQPYTYPANTLGYLLWFNAEGRSMTQSDWAEPSDRLVQLLLGAAGGRLSGLVVFHGGPRRRGFHLPRPEVLRAQGIATAEWPRTFTLQLSTAQDGALRNGSLLAPGEWDTIEGHSITVYSA